VRLSLRKGVLRIVGKGQQVREIPIHLSCAPPSPAGWTTPRLARRRDCFSTSAAPGCRSSARPTSSPRSPQPPAWGTTLSPPTSCATPLK
jgi:hypothetical protein